MFGPGAAKSEQEVFEDKLLKALKENLSVKIRAVGPTITVELFYKNIPISRDNALVF